MNSVRPDAGTYAQGAEIADRHGPELWFHAAPAGQLDTDGNRSRVIPRVLSLPPWPCA